MLLTTFYRVTIFYKDITLPSPLSINSHSLPDLQIHHDRHLGFCDRLKPQLHEISHVHLKHLQNHILKKYFNVLFGPRHQFFSALFTNHLNCTSSLLNYTSIDPIRVSRFISTICGQMFTNKTIPIFFFTALNAQLYKFIWLARYWLNGKFNGYHVKKEKAIQTPQKESFIDNQRYITFVISNHKSRDTVSTNNIQTRRLLE